MIVIDNMQYGLKVINGTLFLFYLRKNYHILYLNQYSGTNLPK